MDPSDDLEFEIVTGEEKSVIGIVRCWKGCTFYEIHHEIADDGIIIYPFDFINNQGHPLNLKKGKKYKVTTTLVGIKRKLDTLDVDMLQSNVVERIPTFENIEENVEGPMHKQPRVEYGYKLVEQGITYWTLGNRKWKF